MMRSQHPSRRGDIPDGALLMAAAASLLILPAWLVLLPDLPDALAAPGTPALQVIAIVGALLLLVPFAYAIAKRSRRTQQHALWLSLHALASLAGTVLVFVHMAGRLLEPPALLMLNLLALMMLGLWARVRGARQMADTFATKTRAFGPSDADRQARMQRLIDDKRALLARLDPAADEAVFSLTLRHRMRQPRLAARYARLVALEMELLGQRASVGFAQAWWRPVHLLLSALFLGGLAVHVIVVIFFAGWVADGDEIYWWHLARWGG